MAGHLAGEQLRVVMGRRQLCLQACCLCGFMEADLAGLVALQPWLCWCSRVDRVCWGQGQIWWQKELVGVSIAAQPV